MSNPFINLCYNIAGKREIKKQREDGQYVLLAGNSFGHPEPAANIVRDEDADSSQKSPNKKRDFINKIFKAKAKNSDDEASIGSVYDQCKGNKDDAALESSHVSKKESKGVINRKKKRSLTFNDNKTRHHKVHPGLAKIIPVLDKFKQNKKITVQNKGVQAVTSTIELDLKPVLTLVEKKKSILEEFDPLWMGEIKEEEMTGNLINQTIPTKPPRNKVSDDKLMSLDNLPDIKLSELKIATMDAIQENEPPVEEIIEIASKDVKKEQVIAKANVSYENLEGVFATPVIHDHGDAVKEGVFPTATMGNDINFDLPKDLAGASHSDILPVFVQPRKNPWNVWPGLFEDSLGMPTRDEFNNTMDDNSKKVFENWLDRSNSMDQLGMLLFQANEKEKETNKKIADFFAEEARVLNEQDIANYSNNIEISKIEIYEEDIKRYHKSLKYHRGPVDHDIIFTTVETALNFIEKLSKEREQKKKIGFLPELLEKCLKSKAQREKEKEAEEKKKKEKEEKKKKGPLKPKMWLVFNRLSKEKVIICTPGEFYDSD